MSLKPRYMLKDRISAVSLKVLQLKNRVYNAKQTAFATSVPAYQKALEEQEHKLVAAKDELSRLRMELLLRDKE